MFSLRIQVTSVLSTGCAESKNDSTTNTMRTSAFEGAQGNCSNGGAKIEILVNGVVDDAQTQYICNGADGQSERDIHNALVATSDEIGENCINGGIRLDFGLDTNDNGMLDDEEILSFHYICNGSNGLDGKNGQDGTNGTNANIITTVFEDEQGSCANGGIKVDVLIDGVVQAGQTKYICNGVNSADGQDGQTGTNTTIQTTPFDSTQGSCTNGGVKIDMLVDGVILPRQTQYICNGTNGVDGTNGTNGSNATIQTTAFTGAQGSCANGGVKIEVLVDSVVQAGPTQYICNGTDSTGECLSDNDCRETAYCDQTTLMCVDKKAQGESCEANQCHGVCWNNVCHEIGDAITFGHYEQDTDTTNGKESIEWRVLDINDDGQLLVISEKVLDVEPCNTTDIFVTWEESTIRSWLNGYGASYNTVGTDFTSDNFIDAAFTVEEKAKIVASNVPAHANPNISISPGNATTDKIFLLSITEANTYFTNDTDRRADATLYAVKKCLRVERSESGQTSGDGTCYCGAGWWLRSPSYSSVLAASVNPDGSVFNFGHAVNLFSSGVRPALWLKY